MKPKKKQNIKGFCSQRFRIKKKKREIGRESLPRGAGAIEQSGVRETAQRVVKGTRRERERCWNGGEKGVEDEVISFYSLRLAAVYYCAAPRTKGK